MKVPQRPVHDVLLEVQDLAVTFGGAEPVVSGVALQLRRGEILGIAGQSGSGKSLTALSALGLLPPGARVQGSIRYRGQELVGMSAKQWAPIRGHGITMIFQETNTALNPVLPVGRQLILAVRSNHECSRAEARERVANVLRDVQLNDVDRVMNSYPHELSGGMSQRVMIAMALACGAEVLLADEPTTALDVTVQREVIDILRRVVDEYGIAAMLISHDLGVLDEVTDRLAVMYLGRVVESGSTAAVLTGPQHPYTQALLACIPRITGGTSEFVEMPDRDYAATPAVMTNEVA